MVVGMVRDCLIVIHVHACLLFALAQLAMDFAVVSAKEIYESKHKLLTMSIGCRMCIKLQRSYNLPYHPDPTPAEQRAGPFVSRSLLVTSIVSWLCHGFEFQSMPKQYSTIGGLGKSQRGGEV